MANRPHQFKNRDITRCLKAASAAGVHRPTVEVHLLPTGGTKYIVGGEVTSQSKKSTQRGAPSRDRPPRVAGGLAMPALPGATGTDNAKRRGR